MENIDPELIEDRRDVWEILGDGGPHDLQNHPGDWWCLKTSEDLIEYRSLLKDDLQCDFQSLTYFVQLARLGSPEGYMECMRIIHHFLKDKDLAYSPDDPQRSSAYKNSQWMKTACTEALEALKVPEEWEQGPARTAKGASKGSWASYNPFAEPQGPGGKGKGSGTSSSSSSSTWQKQGWRG